VKSFLIAALFIRVVVGWSGAIATQARPDLAIRHVNVIDVTGGPTRQDQRILITGDRITSIYLLTILRLSMLAASSTPPARSSCPGCVQALTLLRRQSTAGGTDVVVTARHDRGLSADPLSDIRNTTMVHAVVRAGRLLDRAELDRQLAQVRARVNAGKNR
jgi:hypothetical protein